MMIEIFQCHPGFVLSLDGSQCVDADEVRDDHPSVHIRQVWFFSVLITHVKVVIVSTNLVILSVIVTKDTNLTKTQTPAMTKMSV